MVLAIDAKRDSNAAAPVEVRVGGARCNAARCVGLAQRGVSWAPEILLTSMDRDGTQSGFDVELTLAISTTVTFSDCFRRCEDACRFRGDFLGWSSGRGAGCIHFHDDVQPIRALKEFLASLAIEVRWPC